MINSNSDNGCLYTILLCAFPCAFFIFSIYLMFFIGQSIFTIFAIVWSFISFFVIAFAADQKNKNIRLKENIEKDRRENTIKLQTIERNHKMREDALLRQISKCHQIVDSSAPFSFSASLKADMETAIFNIVEKEMIHKERPAYKSAEKVAELSKKTREAIEKQRTITYRLEYLLQIFPEIRRYIDEDEALLSLANADSYKTFTDERDHSRDYLSDEEWKKLSVDERNQLALDRWKKAPKSNWTIGMLYEMYIGHLLRPKNFDVIQFGIINGLNDFGRDIIAKRKDSDGIERIYIIQCKNWSQKKEIHENVVCQLFGTAMEYQIKHKCIDKQLVIPTLYVTTALSPTAQIFAKRLGVLVYVEPLGEFPLIKCNVNNGNKIYHLPFDQQYWKTKIENDGEFYASTVSEAVSKGFRRAFRHMTI